jgi:hypothetical protein
MSLKNQRNAESQHWKSLVLESCVCTLKAIGQSVEEQFFHSSAVLYVKVNIEIV